MRNTKYFTPEEIFNRLSRSHRSKIQMFHPDDFVDWCAEIEIEIIPHSAYFVKNDSHEIAIKDDKALIPSELYRLELVYTVKDNPEGSFLRKGEDYETDGIYIRLFGRNIPKEKLYIDYTGIPLDPENGNPLILRGHERACEVYCKMKMYEEDYIKSEMNGQIYRDWTQEFSMELTAATGCGVSYQHKDRDEINEVKRGAHNMVYNPNGNTKRH